MSDNTNQNYLHGVTVDTDLDVHVDPPCRLPAFESCRSLGLHYGTSF